jgi:hypothetical protein
MRMAEESPLTGRESYRARRDLSTRILIGIVRVCLYEERGIW